MQDDTDQATFAAPATADAPLEATPAATKHEPAEADRIACRLCGAAAPRAFGLTYLRHIQVCLYRCLGCGSLQTEYPHWLDEAYADARPVRDVWMAGRTEAMRALTS